MSNAPTDLIEHALALMPAEGYEPSLLDGITLMRADSSRPPAPVLQEPTMVVMIQGTKRGYLGNDVFEYGPGECLLVTVPMHFLCDTVVDKVGPMLAITVRIDIPTVIELVSKTLAPPQAHARNLHLGMATVVLDDLANDTVFRLLQALSSAEDTRVLGPTLVRELHYRMLQSSGGDSLRALIAWHGRQGAIVRACERIRRDYAQDLDINTLANEAAMSASAFHQAFKALTGQSPIQYLKAIRLHQAHQHLVFGAKNAAQTAYEVGYMSASQFSREFKRLFGYSPSDAPNHARLAT